MADGSVEGFVHDKFASVREIFEANLAGGADVGASFAATVDGETVVDIWGGWADEARTRAWEKDTIVNVYSIAKTMTALTALLLADRGELDFDAPVARYWPEFAAAGKTRIKISHLMSHSAGLCSWSDKLAVDDLYDWDKATALLAAQAPFWEPGTASGYHAMTQGYLVGEVVRRITGRSLGTIFREEIAEPLAADFHIGLAAEHDWRVADLIAPLQTIGADGGMSALAVNTWTNPPARTQTTATRAWRAAEIPAANGHGNARSIAEIHALLANGGTAKGKRILSEAGCRKALELQVEGMDLVLGAPCRWGLGFALPGTMIALPGPNSMYWWGYGGHLAIIDMDAHTSFGYAMNKMSAHIIGDMRGQAMVNAVGRALAT